MNPRDLKAALRDKGSPLALAALERIEELELELVEMAENPDEALQLLEVALND